MKSTTTPTMTSGESEREVEIDRILGAARAAWRAGIERDERTTRHWSERRLARATGPEARRRSVAKGNGLAIAACVGACALGALAVRRLRPAHEDAGIRPDPSAAVVASAETPAALPGTEPAVAPTVAEPEPSAPVALASHAPSSPPVPRPKPASTELPPLPPLPPPAPEAAPPAKVRRIAVGTVDPDGNVRIEVRSNRAIPPSPPVPPSAEAHRALRAARQELGRGEVERARERLRTLLGQGDPPVAFEAARVLARSHRDPKEQLVVWDQALSRLMVEPYRSLAVAERARVAARLAHDGGT